MIKFCFTGSSFEKPGEFPLVSNRILKQLDYVGKEYYVSFRMLSTDSDDWVSIVHLTTGKDGGIGGRIPGVFHTGNSMLIHATVNGKGDHKFSMRLELGKWHLIEIEQVLRNKDQVIES